MRKPTKPKAKVSKIFRLCPTLTERLERAAMREKRTQTALLEEALRQRLAVKD